MPDSLSRIWENVKRMGKTYRVLKWLVLIAAIGTGVFYFNGLQDLGTGEVEFQGFEDVTAEGFSVKLSVDISNPSRLSVPIASLDYRVFLQSTGELLAEGGKTDLEVESQGNTTINVTPRIQWEGGATAAAEYVREDSVPADVEMDIQLFSFMPAIHLTKTIDLAPAFDQMQEEAGIDEQQLKEGFERLDEENVTDEEATKAAEDIGIT